MKTLTYVGIAATFVLASSIASCGIAAASFAPVRYCDPIACDPYVKCILLHPWPENELPCEHLKPVKPETMGNFCLTQAGIAGPGPWNPVGSSCTGEYGLLGKVVRVITE